MEDSANPPPDEQGMPAPDDASTPGEQPAPNPAAPDSEPPSTGDASAADAPPSTDEASSAPPDDASEAGAPPPDDASGAGAPPNPPPQAARPPWRRIGAGIGALGALLVLVGALLPTHGPGDYVGAALKHAPLILVGLLIAPALVLLGISVLAWFSKPPLWLVVLGCLLIIVALPVHWFISAVFVGLACFDVCPPGGVHYGTGFWLPLVGLPLSGIGVVFAAIAAARQPPKQAAPAT